VIFEIYHYSIFTMNTKITLYCDFYCIIEKYFSLVVFNYLFSNGDAHLKNFSLLESSEGDYLLSPAYDLVNTKLHIDDNDFALNKGLFADEYKSAAYQKNGHPSVIDFIEFAKRIGVSKGRVENSYSHFYKDKIWRRYW
jgi:serine/threonine-protein kinase HipA